MSGTIKKGKKKKPKQQNITFESLVPKKKKSFLEISFGATLPIPVSYIKRPRCAECGNL